MKKITLTLVVCCLSSFVFNTSAQRYLNEEFTAVTKTSNINYGWNYSVLTGVPTPDTLYLDFYEPTGDALAMRPLVIMVHGGSFLPKGVNSSPWGNKGDSAQVEMCMQFAKRGFVAASIDYRLGWNPVATTQLAKASSIMQAVYRSMQDVKACVRFFKNDAATSNTYKIDTNRIILAGDGAGGYAVTTCGALDTISEMQYFKFLDDSGDSFIDMAAWGDLDGNNGLYSYYNHPGHSSKAHLIMQIEGAVGDTLWQEAGDIPMVSFHGMSNVYTPYKTGIVIVLSTGDPVVEVSGSYDLQNVAQRLGNSKVFTDAVFTDVYSQRAESLTGIEGLFPFSGAANANGPHSWWDTTDVFNANGMATNPLSSPTRARMYIDTIMGYFCPRAVVALGLPGDTLFASIKTIPTNSSLFVYPNPTTDQLTIVSNNSSGAIYSIELYNIIGELLEKERNINSSKYTLYRNNLPNGIYFIRVKFKDKFVTQKVIFK